MKKKINKKESEIELLKWFMPLTCRHITITQDDIKKFFEYDEKGLHKEDVKLSHFNDGFNALIAAKQNRGRNMEFWEDGVLSGFQPYYTLLGGEEDILLPRNVVDFIKKEMFKGKDAELIERIYNELCN